MSWVLNYGTVNWERLLRHAEGLQAYSSSESSFTEATHLQSIRFHSGWRKERRAGGAAIGRSEGGDVADRQRDKGRLSEKSERESSWKMADSFLVQEGGSHWSEGDTVPFPAPPGADTSRLRKVILLFPLSQLTACHSRISSLTLSVSGGLYPFRTFIGIDRDKPSYPITLSTNVAHKLFRSKISQRFTEVSFSSIASHADIDFNACMIIKPACASLIPKNVGMRWDQSD